MRLYKHTYRVGENRLIYADKKSGGPEGGSNVTLDDTSKKQLKEIEHSAHTPHGKQVAALYRKGKLDGQTLREIRDLINDPNKMQSKHYQRFIKALSLGRFPSRSGNSLHFLKAISHKGKAGDRAREIVSDLSEDSSGPLTSRKEKALLKELTTLQEKELISETTTSTSSTASLTLQSADIHQKVSVTSETSKDSLLLEKIPKDLIESIKSIDASRFQLTKDAKTIEQAIISENAKPDKDELKIKRLQNQLGKLDEKMKALDKELALKEKEYLEYRQRAHLSYQAAEKFKRESGINPEINSMIHMWIMGLVGKNLSEVSTTLKMTGVKVDPKTGKASRKTEAIEIVGMSFDREKDTLMPQSPGEMLIHYKNENGEVTEASYGVFMDMINVYEGYPEISSFSELNSLIGKETNDIELSDGDQFKAKITRSSGAKGKPITEEVSIKIESIDHENKMIIIDQNFKTTHRGTLSRATHPSLYFDRYKKEFNFGEFARFISKNEFRRPTTKDQTAEALVRLKARQDKETLELKVGTTPEVSDALDRVIRTTADGLTVPTSDSTTEVIFLDNNNKQRFGTLRQNPDSNSFSLQAGQLVEDQSVEDRLLEMSDRVPLQLSAANIARTKLSGAQAEYYQNIPPNKLIDMVDDGMIADLPTETNADGKRKWTVDPEAQNAVAAMERSDKGAGATSGSTNQIPEASDGTEMGSPTSNDLPTATPGQSPGGPSPSGPESESQGPPQKKKKSKGYEEALPFDEVNKMGGMSRKEANFAKKIWAETRMLSVSDFWEMGKAMWEYYDRRWQRRQKERYSSIGEELPFFSPEMRRINQSAENEEVDQFKSTFDQKGIFEIQGRLTDTRNKDEMKASFIVLSEKGQIRWDDIDMWKNLNKFVDAGVAIPIPSNGDPNTKVSSSDDRTGFDFLKEAIDSLWGEGTYSDWFQRNKSSYASNLKNFYEEGKQLEGLQGGHGRRLSELLRQHKKGEYVDAHEYEGLIMHAIEYGKSSMQNKIYFLVEGIAAVNGDGRTILSFDRMAHVNSEMLAKFPLLEYLCASVPRPDGKGTHRWTIDDYKRWVSWFDEGNSMNCTSTPAVDRFMWKYVIPSEPTKNRINKAFRNGEQIDHDDMFAYLPPASEQVITDSTRATTGSKKFFTVEGYANAFPGFSEYFRSLSAAGNGTKLLQAIKSYYRYEAIMTGRFEKDRWNDYQRLDQDTMRRQTIVSNTPPIAFTTELNSVIDKVVAAYDDPELNQLYELSNTVTGDIQVDQNEMAKQREVNAALGKIGDSFDRVIRADGGAKMCAIVAAAPLEGMPYGMSDAEKDARKAAFSDEYNSL
jgi:hypothetical protein